MNRPEHKPVPIALEELPSGKINVILSNRAKNGWYSKEQVMAAHQGIMDAFDGKDYADESAAHALMTIKFCESAVSGQDVKL